MSKVLIAGGGTGGHLFPGLAVAEELRERGSVVHFVGTSKGIEARVVPKEGFPLSLIAVAGIKGRGLRAIGSALALPKAFVQTVALLRKERPDVVLGVGGYASGPVVFLAAMLGIPTLILEQNSVPGITNKILGRVVKRVVIAFPEAATFFPSAKVVELGNPIRKMLQKVAVPGTPKPNTSATPKIPQILILGGSQGAHGVNVLVFEAVTLLKGRGLSLNLVHQTGKTDEVEASAHYQRLGFSQESVKAVSFLEDMATAYANADLVVARAGATTLAELTAVGLPAILIPFPHATDDHQTKNARYLEEKGAALVLPQNGTSPAQLAKQIEGLLSDQNALARMAQASRSLGRRDAASSVADVLLGLAS